MDPWKFFDYINANGDNVIANWMEELPVRAQAEIDARLRYLAQQTNFKRPHTGEMGGGLYEICIVQDGIQYRPLFTYGPNRKNVTLLVGATKKQGKSRGKKDVQWSPANALALARMRKLEVDKKTVKVVPHESA